MNCFFTYSWDQYLLAFRIHPPQMLALGSCLNFFPYPQHIASPRKQILFEGFFIFHRLRCQNIREKLMTKRIASLELAVLNKTWVNVCYGRFLRCIFKTWDYSIAGLAVLEDRNTRELCSLDTSLFYVHLICVSNIFGKSCLKWRRS